MVACTCGRRRGTALACPHAEWGRIRGSCPPRTTAMLKLVLLCLNVRHCACSCTSAPHSSIVSPVCIAEERTGKKVRAAAIEPSQPATAAATRARHFGSSCRCLVPTPLTTLIVGVQPLMRSCRVRKVPAGGGSGNLQEMPPHLQAATHPTGRQVKPPQVRSLGEARQQSRGSQGWWWW